MEAGIGLFKKLGCELLDIHMPHTDYAIATYYIIATAEASSNLARYEVCGTDFEWTAIPCSRCTGRRVARASARK